MLPNRGQGTSKPQRFLKHNLYKPQQESALRLSKLIALLVVWLSLLGFAWAAGPADAKTIPVPKLSKFKPTGAIAEPADPGVGVGGATALMSSEYAGPNGSRIWVDRFRFPHEAKAYEILSLFSARARASNPNVEIVNGIGTAGYSIENEITFFKGVYVVRLRQVGGRAVELNELAHAWSEVLDRGEGDIPVLIKHLPDPGEAQKKAAYLTSFYDLDRLPFQHAIFDAIQPGGNADAALATYGPSKFLIVEFNTPQLAADNDRRIIARIQEQWKLGQPAPTAYRRVGNYSVLVFDAPDEQTAKQLIDQVKYEQVVRWLGENPNILKEAERHYVNTTLGVLIAVVKASGYALFLCFGMGALLGGLLFSYRRSQQKNVAAFSDAGGMLRLNLDDLSETKPSRLLPGRN